MGRDMSRRPKGRLPPFVALFRHTVKSPAWKALSVGAMVQGAHLGTAGTGKAALYRLTDCAYAGKPPTYDFQSWDGILYDPKKQNPVRKNRTPCPKRPDIRAESQITQNVEHRPDISDIRNPIECPKKPDITSFTSFLHLAAIADGAPPQSAVAVGDGADERQEWADLI